MLMCSMFVLKFPSSVGEKLKYVRKHRSLSFSRRATNSLSHTEVCGVDVRRTSKAQEVVEVHANLLNKDTFSVCQHE